MPPAVLDRPTHQDFGLDEFDLDFRLTTVGVAKGSPLRLGPSDEPTSYCASTCPTDCYTECNTCYQSTCSATCRSACPPPNICGTTGCFE